MWPGPPTRPRAQAVGPRPYTGLGEALRVRGLTRNASGMPTAALADVKAPRRRPGIAVVLGALALVALVVERTGATEQELVDTVAGVNASQADPI